MSKSLEEGDKFFESMKTLPKTLRKIGRKQKRERKRIKEKYGEGLASLAPIINSTRLTMARGFKQTGKRMELTELPVVSNLGTVFKLAGEGSLTNGKSFIEDPEKIGRIVSAGIFK